MSHIRFGPNTLGLNQARHVTSFLLIFFSFFFLFIIHFFLFYFLIIFFHHLFFSSHLFSLAIDLFFFFSFFSLSLFHLLFFYSLSSHLHLYPFFFIFYFPIPHFFLNLHLTFLFFYKSVNKKELIKPWVHCILFFYGSIYLFKQIIHSFIQINFFFGIFCLWMTINFLEFLTPLDEDRR